jgi:AcrR family transcriptional regulator
MGRPKTDPTIEPTRERILAAAERSFAESGYEAKLADIGEAAGIRRPSLLYHFASKEVLFSAVVERAFTRLGSALELRMHVEGSFRDRIDALVNAYLEFLRGHPHFAPLLLREILDGRGPGRELILARAVPLLDALEAFLRGSGSGQLRADISPRAAVLQLATSALVREASGSLKQPLWGEGEHIPALARALLLDPTGESS